MFLAVDVGNSGIKLAVFDGDKIIKTTGINLNQNKFTTILRKELESIYDFGITDCGIISVVEGYDSIIKKEIDTFFNIQSLIISNDTLNIVKIKTKKPQSTGIDRIANVYSALDYTLPAIIIDIGTAITFDIISANKEFIGGIIMPGLNAQLKALSTTTSKLPLTKLREANTVIGNSTETAIISGVVRGTACAIDGLISQCKEELGNCRTVILTGGQADIISEYMKSEYKLRDKNWTLKGIKIMYDNYTSLERRNLR